MQTFSKHGAHIHYLLCACALETVAAFRYVASHYLFILHQKSQARAEVSLFTSRACVRVCGRTIATYFFLTRFTTCRTDFE